VAEKLKVILFGIKYVEAGGVRVIIFLFFLYFPGVVIYYLA
jgi:hypothetical protein